MRTLPIILLLIGCSGARVTGEGPDTSGEHGPGRGSATPQVWAGPAPFQPPEDIRWAYEASTEVIPGLEPDRRLGRAAASLARLLREQGGTPSRVERSTAAREAEVAEPVPVLLVISSPDPDRDRLSELLRERLERQCRGIECNRVGIAMDHHGGRNTVVALAMTSRLTLRPVPVLREPGQMVTLRGTVLADAEQVEILLSTPRGNVETLLDSEQREFDVTRQLEETGVYRLEVVARLAGSPTVLALVRVEVGAPGTAARPTAPAGETTNPILVRQRLLELVNASRVEAGLTTLARDGTLARAAQAYAEAMLAQDFFGHLDPQGRGPADRVREAGALCSVVLENLAIARSAEEGHVTLRESPIHWRATVDARTTHAGIGVAGTSGEGLRMVIVMARMLPPFEPTQAARQVAAAIAAARAERSAPVLTFDPAMSTAAAAAADHLVRDSGATDDARAAAVAALEGQPLSSLTAVLLTTSDLADAAGVGAVLDPGFRRAGVAVRLARGETTGYHVVVLLGQ